MVLIVKGCTFETVDKKCTLFLKLKYFVTAPVCIDCLVLGMQQTLVLFPILCWQYDTLSECPFEKLMWSLPYQEHRHSFTCTTC